MADLVLLAQTTPNSSKALESRRAFGKHRATWSVRGRFARQCWRLRVASESVSFCRPGRGGIRAWILQIVLTLSTLLTSSKELLTLHHNLPMSTTAPAKLAASTPTGSAPSLATPAAVKPAAVASSTSNSSSPAVSTKCTCCAISCGVCANKNSKKFHGIGCSHFKREGIATKIDVGQDNQVCFKDFAAAIAAGYTPCAESKKPAGVGLPVAVPATSVKK